MRTIFDKVGIPLLITVLGGLILWAFAIVFTHYNQSWDLMIEANRERTELNHNFRKLVAEYRESKAEVLAAREEFAQQIERLSKSPQC